MAEFKVRRGYGPEVSADVAKVPGIYLSDRAGAIYAGGLRNLASGLNSLSSGVASFAAKQKEEKEREDSFNVQMALTGAQTNAMTSYQQAKLTAEPGAETFVASNAAQIEQANQEVLKSLQSSGVGDRGLKIAQLGLADIQHGIIQKSLAYQEQSREQLFDNKLQDANKGFTNLALMDPEAVEKYIEQWNATVETYPANVNEMVREDLRRKGEDVIRKMALSSYARQNPEKIVGAFEGTADLSNGDPRALLRKFEGYRDKPYWDVNHNRVGYGSDTVTLADGTVKRVTRGMRITKEDAERDLARRVMVEQQQMARQLGPEVFSALPGATRAALTSVAYNYGGLPKSVIAATKTGDNEAIAQAVEALGTHNNGVNRKRRAEEANVIRTGQFKGDFGSGLDSDPVLANASAADRLAALRAAETQINSNQAQRRGEIQAQLDNEIAAYQRGKEYEGESPTDAEIRGAWDPVDAEQKIAQRNKEKEVGAFRGEMDGLSMSAINNKLATLEPDTSSPNYAVEADVYDSAVKARDAIQTARKDDAAQYVMTNYPGFSKLAQAAQETGNVAAYNKALWEAYDQLEIPAIDRKAFTETQAEQLEAQVADMSASEQLDFIMELEQSMPPEMYEVALEQLDENGMTHQAMAAGLLHQARDKEHRMAATNALQGYMEIQDNDSIKIAKSKFQEDYASAMNNANLGIKGTNNDALFELAIGHYYQTGGNMEAPDPDKFHQSLRVLLGGTASDPNTGVVDLSKGEALYNTILPTGKTAEEFTRAIGRFTIDDYNYRGNGPMTTEDGEFISAEDIAEDGVFVRVGTEHYQIAMGLDGNWVHNAAREPYKIKISSKTVDAYNMLADKDVAAEDAAIAAEEEAIRQQTRGAADTSEIDPSKMQERFKHNQVYGEPETKKEEERGTGESSLLNQLKEGAAAAVKKLEEGYEAGTSLLNESTRKRSLLGSGRMSAREVEEESLREYYRQQREAEQEPAPRPSKEVKAILDRLRNKPVMPVTDPSKMQQRFMTPDDGGEPLIRRDGKDYEYRSPNEYEEGTNVRKGSRLGRAIQRARSKK